MPANFSTLFDTLLVLAGLVLVATGLVMFIRSKTSTQASSVEAFGIKLNVTHPSLILVLAGVGLMLAPRLLPEPAVVATPPPQAAAPATPTSPEPASQPAQPFTAPPAVTGTATPPPPPEVKPAAPPQAPPSVTVAQPIQPAKPWTPAPSVPKKPVSKPASVSPAPSPAPASTPAPAAAVTAEKPAASSPPATTKPARPTLAYAALGLPINRSFWDNETRASYTQRIRANLQQTGREVLHIEARGIELGQAEFDAWWNESKQHTRSRELCAASPAPLALLSARVETPTAISSVESAYWPELKLRLFVCANQRIYRQQKTLAPQNDDAWPFATELNSEIERFLRTYRADLAN